MSSAYRDRTLRCPKCLGDMARPTTRDLWQCPKCRGVFTPVADVIEQLLRIAPDLLPVGGVGSIVTPKRRAMRRPHACPSCSEPFAPVLLGGVEIDRCYRDEALWFDANELERVMETAAEQHRQRNAGFLRYLRELFTR